MAAPRERPILFSGPMVRAILDGRKTVTRRVVKGVDRANQMTLKKPTKTLSGLCTHVLDAPARGLCPYGSPGDRLWVRETWRGFKNDRGSIVQYRASVDEEDPTDRDFFGRWRPSIHMPRWASRITLEVTDVRVERVQEVTEEDARAEGVHVNPDAPAALYDRTAFARLWDSINQKRGFGWDANPWVWVVRFRRIEP